MAGVFRVMSVVPRPLRSVYLLLPLSALLYACGDRDVTVAGAPPEPAAPSEPSEAAPPARAPSLVIEPVDPGKRQWSLLEPSEVSEGGLDPASTPVSQETSTPEVTPGPGTGPSTPVDEPASEPTPAPPLDCSAITPVPASFEVLQGFTSSEDFVFDELGNYVGIDDDNNLVRISRDRKRTLWLPKIGSLAGMGILPDGSVVFNEVAKGALERVYPNGGVSVIVGGLLYPNGLDIGPDGFVYVAENNAGRVRRINPDTGEFSIVAMGLMGPNGVAFSNDPHVLYIGSFEGSGVYKVELGAPGELGKASVFARPPGSRLREPVLACPDQIEGVPCSGTPYAVSTCQALANVVDCLPVDPCSDLDDGAFCDFPAGGVCKSHVCDPYATCDELGTGAACRDPYGGTPGVCQTIDDLYSYCAPPNVCDGLADGEACEDPYSGPGTCIKQDGYTYCQPPDPCAGLADGDACTDFYSGPGVCHFFEEGYGYCEAFNPCDGLSDGDACVDFSFGAGVCTALDDAYIYCSPPNPCDGLSLGAACEDQFSGPGVCQSVDGYTYCAPPGPCDELADGEACSDPYAGSGVCQSQDGYHYCAPPNPCDGLSENDACQDPSFGDGVCIDTEGTLYCTLVSECLTLVDGDPCEDPYLGPGSCLGGQCVTYEQTGGGIDGMGVDACGNVYASEYVVGKVWRIAPTGEIELMAELPSSWIPNIKWGRGLGGFGSDVMYVADRDQQRLFGIYVGVPGATEFFAAGQ